MRIVGAELMQPQLPAHQNGQLTHTLARPEERRAGREHTVRYHRLEPPQVCWMEPLDDMQPTQRVMDPTVRQSAVERVVSSALLGPGDARHIRQLGQLIGQDVAPKHEQNTALERAHRARMRPHLGTEGLLSKVCAREQQHGLQRVVLTRDGGHGQRLSESEGRAHEPSLLFRQRPTVHAALCLAPNGSIA